MTLVLASASPRRQQLLTEAGYALEVRPVDVDEERLAGEAPYDYVRRVARLKADEAVRRFPGRVVLAADTTVVLGDVTLGKPGDPEEARRMLRDLSGRAHEVLTAVWVIGRAPAGVVETTRVWFRTLSEADIAWYVGTGEPVDKAGAYAIQGLGARFVDRIEGDFANVVGLPVGRVAALLRAAGAPAGNEGEYPIDHTGVDSPQAGPYPD